MRSPYRITAYRSGLWTTLRCVFIYQCVSIYIYIQYTIGLHDTRHFAESVKWPWEFLQLTVKPMRLGVHHFWRLALRQRKSTQ